MRFFWSRVLSPSFSFSIPRSRDRDGNSRIINVAHSRGEAWSNEPRKGRARERNPFAGSPRVARSIVLASPRFGIAPFLVLLYPRDPSFSLSYSPSGGCSISPPWRGTARRGLSRRSARLLMHYYSEPLVSLWFYMPRFSVNILARFHGALGAFPPPPPPPPPPPSPPPSPTNRTAPRRTDAPTISCVLCCPIIFSFHRCAWSDRSGDCMQDERNAGKIVTSALTFLQCRLRITCQSRFFIGIQMSIKLM